MDQQEKNIQITNAIQSARTIAIMPNKVSNLDAFSAGVGLYYMLKDLDKDVTFIYQGKTPEDSDDLIEKSEIKTEVGSKDLVISVDYSNSPAAKAQYSTNNGVLFLKLGPVTRDFDLSRVQSEFQRKSYDLIFTVGAQIPEDFGQIYRDIQEDFSKSKVVNIDNTERNLRYGAYNVIDSSEHTLSVLVLNISRFWGLKVGTRSAKALLKGISQRMA